MNKICKRMTSSLLAIIMLISAVGMEVSATEANSVDNDVQMESLVKANNNTTQDATVIGSLPYQKTGSLVEGDAIDYYKFTLAAPGRVTFNVNSTTLGTVYFYLYGSDGQGIWNTYRDYSSVTGYLTLDVYSDLTAGTYYFAVEKYRYSDAYGNYDLKMGYSKANESFPESGNGNNNLLSQAQTINVNTSYVGQIAANDGADYFMFTIPKSGKVTFDVKTNQIEEFQFAFYNSSYEKMDDDHVYRNTTTGYTLVNDINYLTAGTYYFSVMRYEYSDPRTGIYNFSVNYTPSNESFAETGKGTNNITSQANAISLKKTYIGQIGCNDGADFYCIKMDRTQNLTIDFTSYINRYVYVNIYNSQGQRVDGYTQYVESNESKSNKKTTYELQKGIYYIGIEQGDGQGQYAFSTNVYIEQPEITSVTCTGKGMSVKWDKVVGATKYYVYRKANNGKYSRVAVINSGSKKSYLDKKAKKNGTKYTYKIAAYNPVCGKSKESKKVYSYYLTTPKLTKAGYSKSSDVFTLKWNKNSKCSGYEIGYTTSKSSGYSTYTVSGRSNSSIKLEFWSKASRYFKIRSYVNRGGKKHYSPWSKVKYVKAR